MARARLPSGESYSYESRALLPAALALGGGGVRNSVERHVYELVADLLDAANVDRLHHVARLGVDRHRAARAFPLQALRRRDHRLAVGVALGLLQRLVDRVHAVVAADR